MPFIPVQIDTATLLYNKIKNRKRYVVKNTAKRKVFHLPVEQAVYVPSTTKGDRPVSRKVLNSRVSEVRRYLSEKYGGYTSTDSTGGYISDKKGLIKERVVKVTSFGEYSKWRKNKNTTLNKVADWQKKWGQESVGYEHEGDLYYISQKEKKIKRNKTRRNTVRRTRFFPRLVFPSFMR